MNSIELTKKLIEIESTDPGVYEFEIQKYLKSLLDELKPYGVEVFESEVCGGRKNLMGFIGANAAHAVRSDVEASRTSNNAVYAAHTVRSDVEASRTSNNAVYAAHTVRSDAVVASRTSDTIEDHNLVLICHMDTVVVGNDWTKEALKATEENGRIYGRGSTDMKSGLAVAFKTFEYAAKEIGKENLKMNLKIIFTVDEEADMKGVEKAIEDGWINEKTFAVDFEPTDKMIQVSHKGRFWIKLNVKGKTAHASKPELGVDANACLAEIITFVRHEVDKLPIDGELGKSTVTFGLMGGGYEPYVVPDEAYVTMDFRLTPPTYNHDIIGIINKAIANAKRLISDKAIITYQVTGDREFVKKNDDSIILGKMKQTLTELYKKEKDDDYIPIVTSFSGYTDTAVIASKLKTGETFSYGPGSLSLAHKPDEYVEIKDIERCEKVYKEFIKSMVI